MLELQQHFALASNWRCHVDDEKCLPLPSDYIKPVQGFILAYKVSYEKYNPLTDQSDYRITPSYTLNALNSRNLHWKLAFNSSKCKLLRILSPNQNISSTNYTINNCIIDMTCLHRDLGVLVSDSSELTWTDH